MTRRRRTVGAERDLDAVTRWLADLAGVPAASVPRWLRDEGFEDAEAAGWHARRGQLGAQVVTAASIVAAERARRSLGRLELRADAPLRNVREEDLAVLDRLPEDDASRSLVAEVYAVLDESCPYPACRDTRTAGLRLVFRNNPEVAALADLLAREAAYRPVPLLALAEPRDGAPLGERRAAQVREGGRNAAEAILDSGVLEGRMAEIAALPGYGAPFVQLIADQPAEIGWLLVQVPWLHLPDPTVYGTYKRTANVLAVLARAHDWRGPATLRPSEIRPPGMVLRADACAQFMHVLDDRYEQARTAMDDDEDEDGPDLRRDVRAWSQAHRKLDAVREILAVARRHGLTGTGKLTPIRKRPTSRSTGVSDDTPTWEQICRWLEIAIPAFADRPTMLLQLLLMVCTGARPKEVVRVWRGSFSPIGDGHWLVWVRRRDGKSGAYPLRLLRPLADAFGLRPELWPADPPPESTAPVTANVLRKAVAAFDATLAVTHPDRVLPGRVLYRYRHALARAMAESLHALGEDVRYVSLLLRHQGEAATTVYTTISSAMLADAANEVGIRLFGPYADTDRESPP
jgi:hypothetical protein